MSLKCIELLSLFGMPRRFSSECISASETTPGNLFRTNRGQTTFNYPIQPETVARSYYLCAYPSIKKSDLNKTSMVCPPALKNAAGLIGGKHAALVDSKGFTACSDVTVLVIGVDRAQPRQRRRIRRQRRSEAPSLQTQKRTDKTCKIQKNQG